MARKSKQDWLEAALTLLAEVGAENLTIEAMTTHLNVTKGSFYHHFGNYEGFLAALLEYYEVAGTLQIIEESEKGDTAPEKLDRLLAATLAYPPDTEIAMRAWALQNATVRAVQAKIDARRTAYMVQLYTELTGDPDTSAITGKMIYAIYVGGQQIIPHYSTEDMNAIFEQFVSLIQKQIRD